METSYPVVNVQPEWILQTESLGSKEKFWYRETDEGSNWLFKHSQDQTGQHWAEKMAAELAALMDVRHARVEFALYGTALGVTCESFARDGRQL